MSKWLIAVGLAFISGCSSCSGGSSSGDGGSDGTGETDSESTSLGTDSVTQSEDDSESATQSTDTETPSDTVTDTGTSTNELPMEVECDAGPPVIDTEGYPVAPGCAVVAHSIDISFGQNWAMDGDYLVWQDLIEGCNPLAQGIVVRQLSTGISKVIDYTPVPRNQVHPTTDGTWVYWLQETTLPGSSYNTDFFKKNVLGGIRGKVTDTSYVEDGFLMPGIDYVVYFNVVVSGSDDKMLYYQNILTGEATEIVPDAVSPPSPGIDFDGERYVVWVYNDRMHLFDIQNPATSEPLVPYGHNQVWPSVKDGFIYAGTSIVDDDPNMGFDIWFYNIETHESGWLTQSPFDQLGQDVDGRLIAFVDTEELESIWFNNQNSHITLMDLDSKVKRKLTLVDDDYYGIVINGKYLAYGVNVGGDIIVLCDLEAGGFIDNTGHVIPAEKKK